MTVPNTIDLRATERSFLFAFIALRLLLFARTFGMFLGYDVRGHLAVISSISWAHPFLPLRLSYYSWHPPLGFLLAHTLTLLGISPLLSAQILSFIASLIAFFFMRLALRSLDVLQTLPGILFLYIGASIPMQIYLSVIVSLDVFVLAFTSMAFFLCIQLFWKRQTVAYAFVYGFFLIIVLMLAILSKQSGFLLLVLPGLFFLFSKGVRTAGNFCTAALITAISFFFGICYLYYRHYLPSLSFFFNSAGTVIWLKERAHAVLIRDSNVSAFFLSYVLPIGGGPRLFPTWASYWFMFDQIPASIVARSFGLFMCAFGVFPLPIGLVVFLRNKVDGAWRRFGFLMISFCIFQLLFLCYYIYSLPMLGYISNKGIYIASSSWGIAYCFAEAIQFVISYGHRFQAMSVTKVFIERMALFFVILFMLINHIFPAISQPSLIY